ncbi:DUF6603 domain-containing protein [Streptomyces sp. NPDC012756]|uniref:DUF6603 domain-containing protein n=1 Tax=Streptomyces sp. NPDC012756 TaxID=3364847 RepID=UPI0036805ED3
MPSFVTPPDRPAGLRLFHASCRKPHAEGTDALSILDEVLAADAGSAVPAADPDGRPDLRGRRRRRPAAHVHRVRQGAARPRRVLRDDRSRPPEVAARKAPADDPRRVPHDEHRRAQPSAALLRVPRHVPLRLVADPVDGGVTGRVLRRAVPGGVRRPRQPRPHGVLRAAEQAGVHRGAQDAHGVRGRVRPAGDLPRHPGHGAPGARQHRHVHDVRRPRDHRRLVHLQEVGERGLRHRPRAPAPRQRHGRVRGLPGLGQHPRAVRRRAARGGGPRAAHGARRARPHRGGSRGGHRPPHRRPLRGRLRRPDHPPGRRADLALQHHLDRPPAGGRGHPHPARLPRRLRGPAVPHLLRRGLHLDGGVGRGPGARQGDRAALPVPGARRPGHRGGRPARRAPHPGVRRPARTGLRGLGPRPARLREVHRQGPRPRQARRRRRPAPPRDLPSKALDSVLFPRDPLSRAPEIVATLGAVFPPTPGRHVVGPMARIGWGTPTLLTLDLALLLELPTPVRLVLLGRLRMALPTEEAAAVVVNMDVLGVIDFERVVSA